MVYNVTEEDSGKRLDVFISEKDENITRSYVKKLFEEGHISVNGRNVKISFKVKPGDSVFVDDIQSIKSEIPDIEPENIPLDILYEDSDIIVVNKPKNMVVHPAPGHYTGTLVNALMYHCKDSLSGINGVLRPGIVHRIDKDTTGVLVACKNDNSHRSLAAQLKEHSITREYRAVVTGYLKESKGTIDTIIGRDPKNRKKQALNVKNGKHAVTHYEVIDELNKQYTYIKCTLETGRTHQIRVSMAGIGHPLLGDELYGKKSRKFNTQGQVLHAAVLGFIHPSTGKYMEFHADLPEYFKKILNVLKVKGGAT